MVDDPQRPQDTGSTECAHNGTGASTPSISRFDGTPLFLLPFPQPDVTRPPSPLALDMAFKSVPHAKAGLSVDDANVNGLSPTSGNQTLLSPHMNRPDQGLPPCSPGQDPGPRLIPSVGDLAHLLRLEKYQRSRAYGFQAQLKQAQVATAKTSRLLSIARTAQQTLAECIRCEDKHGFISLSTTLREALANSAETRADLGCQPCLEEEDTARSLDNFADALPCAARATLCDFLSSIRRDPDFIADRLSALSPKDLLALLPQRTSPRSSESVFESSVRNESRMSQSLGYVVDSQTDQLLSLDAASPLEALFWSTRNLYQQLQDDATSREVWARACARLVSDQQRGMEKVVPAIIEMWSASAPWPGKDRVEAWIIRVLQDGAFVLDQPSRQSFRVRIQGRPDPGSEDESKAEAFFARAVQSLLGLLAELDGASAIPDMAVSLCRHICGHIPSEGPRRAFCNFVLTRWLFNSFVVDAITLPESFAMTISCYISDNARQRILREVVVRCQKAVYHALHPWKHSLPVPKQVVDTVSKIAGRFYVPTESRPPPSSTVNDDPHRTNQDMLAVSLSDVIALLDALYPDRRPPSCISESESSGLHSSSSSVSGFSLFSTPSSSSTTLAYQNFPRYEDQSMAFMLDLAKMEPHGESSTPPDRSLSTIPLDKLRNLRASVEELNVNGRYSMSQQLAVLHLDSTRSEALTPAMESPCSKDPGCPADFRASKSDTADTDNTFMKMQFRDALQGDDSAGSPSGGLANLRNDPQNWLLRYMEMRMATARDRGQFVLSHSHAVALARCRQLLSEEKGQLTLGGVLVELQDEAATSLQHSLDVVATCERQTEVVRLPLHLGRDALGARLSQCDSLRRKMLYIADVRTSAPYDEMRSIASALKVMGRPKKPSKTRVAPPLRHWSGSKVSSTNLHLKTEAQILEILSASANHGGPSKLSDDQSTALAAWLLSNNIENLCAGEEHLHKLCMDLRKAVDQLTRDTSPLWSSPLAMSDRACAGSNEGTSSPLVPSPVTSRFDALRLHTHVPSVRGNMSSTTLSQPLSARSSRDLMEVRSPTLTSRSSGPFWSPSASDVMSPASVTSVGSTHAHDSTSKHLRGHATASNSRDEELATTRSLLTSLLLSEVTASMFSEGSETDQAFWTGPGGEIAAKHFRVLNYKPSEGESGPPQDAFNFREALETLTRNFECSCDPVAKLNILVEMDALIGLRDASRSRSSTSTQMHHAQKDLCSAKPVARRTSSQIKLDGFRMLYCDRRTRPRAIFRDLQWIAALVPSIATEKSARGDAFWHASLAITGLKKEICALMVETADSIIAYHSNNRGHGRSASSAQEQRDSATFSSSSRTPPAEDVATYSMADAAHLLQITAKEGNAVAQRELATLYLTNPELMDHIIAPLSRPRDVFKEELESKWRKNQDPTRCDPATMCVAHHWMSLSAKGGDALAKEYLKQREEMERLP